MSKAASGAMLTALAQDNTFLCRIWQITLTNGTIFRFTDMPQSVSYASNTYSPDPGMNVTAVNQTVDGGTQNAQVSIVFATSVITEDLVRGGFLDKAPFTLKVIDWSAPANGEIVLMQGEVADIQFDDKGACTLNVRGLLSDKRGNLGNEFYSKTCRASLGDARCTKDLTALTVAGTVATVDGTSPGKFTAAAMVGVQTDGFYEQGIVTWLTGANAGRKDDVLTNTAASGTIVVTLAPPFPIQVGDTFSVVPGCNKQVTTCRLKFNNLPNFRGEAYAPAPNNNPLSAFATTGVAALRA